MFDVTPLGRSSSGDYQVHEVRYRGGKTIIAYVTAYDGGRITIEFDSDIAYPLNQVRELVDVAFKCKPR